VNNLPEVGRLMHVELRDVWPHEAHSFTPWVLENADRLSEALGMDLEIEAAEHSVGNFQLDLIGTDLDSGQRVIIENQLESTDHKHLGQILTYAGGTDPKIIIWNDYIEFFISSQMNLRTGIEAVGGFSSILEDLY